MRRNALEWLILAGSVAALVGLAGYLVVQVVTGPADAPRIVAELQVDAASDGPSGWSAPLVVRNEGGEAARAIAIEVTAEVAGREEVASIALDLLAPVSEATVVIGFSGPPSGDPVVRVAAYEVP